jgi:tRNA(Ile)-lysidine synthase
MDAGELAGELLARCSFPSPGTEPVSLAVSGGPDSLALIVLARCAGLKGDVIHVDHGLRDGSAAEAEVVAQAAARFSFAFVSRSVDVAPGPDLEARARQARYGALPPGVLTGHTMDDQAETVLLNVLRGAALDGLCGIRAGSDVRIRRPLLSLRRSETVALCRTYGLTPVHDPSNQDARFRRNRVRSEVLPLLCDVAGRDVVPVLARQAALLADDAELLQEMASGLDPTDAGVLRHAPVALARRAVRSWLRSVEASGDAEAHPPSSEEVARVLAVAEGRVRACELAGGRRVQRRAGRLHIVVPTPAQ